MPPGRPERDRMPHVECPPDPSEWEERLAPYGASTGSNPVGATSGCPETVRFRPPRFAA